MENFDIISDGCEGFRKSSDKQTTARNNLENFIMKGMLACFMTHTFTSSCYGQSFIINI